MTWFKHKCWFCGHVSRQLDFLTSGHGYPYEHRSRYQCKDGEACQQRRWAKRPWERRNNVRVRAAVVAGPAATEQT